MLIKDGNVTMGYSVVREALNVFVAVMLINGDSEPWAEVSRTIKASLVIEVIHILHTVGEIVYTSEFRVKQSCQICGIMIRCHLMTNLSRKVYILMQWSKSKPRVYMVNMEKGE
ncbi:hypothetical protein SCA6_009751 [Theobroma cacao]